MGFALWIDTKEGLAWAQGTHEYRVLGAAVIAVTDQFRNRDFRQSRSAPRHLYRSFAGFFGSLETVNEYLQSDANQRRLRTTPSHLRRFTRAPSPKKNRYLLMTARGRLGLLQV